MSDDTDPGPEDQHSAPGLPILADLAQRRTAREIVVESLRKGILGGRLPPGTRLRQSQIATQLGVSTTPVREAMRDLAAKGLVQFDPYRGAIVRQATLEEAREIYELRLILEPIAIRKAVAAMSIAELDEAAEMAVRASRERDPGTWVELNREFHMRFTEGARAPRLISILQSLQDSAAIHVGLSIQARQAQMLNGNADHLALVEAVRERDAEAAVHVIQQHLASTLQAIQSANDTRPEENRLGRG